MNPFSLWLKAEGYGVSLINIIPTATYAVQFVCTIVLAVLSDYWRNRPAAMSISTAGGLFAALVLAIWSIPSGLKWTAFMLSKFYVPYGPMAMSW